MFRIDKDNHIYITRGDTAFITITLDTTVELREEDIIRCQVRQAPNGGHCVFEGAIERGEEIVWHIKPADTKGVKPGTYVYDIQLELPDSGDVFTIIPVSLFTIEDEVTGEVI